MKKRILFLTLTGIFSFLFQGQVNAQSAEIRPNQGVSVPQFTTAFITAMTTQPKGTVVFDKDLNVMKYWDGTAWQTMSGGSGGSGWALNGNAGTTAANFIGTTDDNDVFFKRNNAPAGRISGAIANTSFGLAALNITGTGAANTAFGTYNLQTNTTGYGNTSVGTYGLATNSTGFNNTAMGYNALISNSSGKNNTSLGRDALFSNTTGSNNVGIGIAALRNNTTEGSLVAIGDSALMNNTIGSTNTAIGSKALLSNTSGQRNVAVGFETLRNNSAIPSMPSSIPPFIATGSYNVAIGYRVLFKNSTGYSNIGVGDGALNANTIGKGNVAVGDEAMFFNTTGNNNVSIGNGSLVINSVGNNNVAIGASALGNNRESGLVAIGENSMLNNISGTGNTAMGSSSLFSNTGGSANTSIGNRSFYNNTTGNNNTGAGFEAGFNILPDKFNVSCFGYQSGFASTISNHINIGNSTVSFIGGQVGWGTYSDGRIKNNVKENVPGLGFIKALRPVTYNLDIIKQDSIGNEGLAENIKSDSIYLKNKLNRSKPKYPEEFEVELQTQTGFIAQEVEAAAKKTGYDFSGVYVPKNGKGLYSLRYSEFVVPLVKAVQEQQDQIENLEKTNQAQKEEILALQSKNKEIESILVAQAKTNAEVKTQQDYMLKMLAGIKPGSKEVVSRKK
jgi:trimeric autotransporter adhesin